MKRLYRVEQIDRSICPPRNPPLRSLTSAWSLLAGSLAEERSFIQIDHAYVVSLGHHFLHQNALLSAGSRVDYFLGLEICNVLSYFFDTPISLGVSLKPRDGVSALRGLGPYFKAHGIPFSDVQGLQAHLAEADAYAHLDRDDWQRLLPIDPARDPSRVIGLALPSDVNLQNACVAYRQALVSPDPVGQILNYWRVLEATARSKAKRIALLRRLRTTRLNPVRCSRLQENQLVEFNAISVYRRLSYRHLSRLRRAHGSDDAAMQFLYSQRRCPSAHAKSDALRPGPAAQLRDLYYDATLLKLLARLSIELYWSGER